MEKIDLDKLPEIIYQIFEKIEHIEIIIQNLATIEKSENDYLTIIEAAAFLKITIPSLYAIVSRREIPVSKPGKKLYFNKTDLIEWIKSGKQKTMSEIQEMVNERLKRHDRYFGR